MPANILVPQDLANFTLKPKIYSVYFASILLGATATGTVSIQENTAFLVTDIEALFYNSAALATQTYLTFQVTDNGAGRTFFDRKLPTAAFAAAQLAKFPRTVLSPYMAAGNTTLNVEVTSLEPALTSIGWVMFHGVHLYTRAGGEVRNLINV